MHAVAQQKRMVVVLGMHRSGTSLITRALQAMGVSLGDHLLPPAEDNQKGFWEDRDINTLNIGLLEALGHDWHTLAPILPRELADPVVPSFKLRALEILRERLSTTDHFGLKDPRIARLLPFWQDVFAHLRINVCYVIVSRNPLSVARSLAKRSGFALEKGYHLWLEHMLLSLVGTENCQRVVTDYDRFLENPAGELRRIAQILDLNLNTDDPRVTEFVTGFLDHSLRHNHYRVEDLDMENVLPPKVALLYQALLQLAAQPPGCDNAEVASVIEAIRAKHRDDYPMLRYMDGCDERIRGAAQQIAALTQQIADLGNSVTAHQATILRLQNEISQLNSQLSIIYASRSWRTARLLSKIFLPFKRPFISS